VPYNPFGPHTPLVIPRSSAGNTPIEGSDPISRRQCQPASSGSLAVLRPLWARSPDCRRQGVKPRRHALGPERAFVAQRRCIFDEWNGAIERELQNSARRVLYPLVSA
jgi:hypothetical protein